MEAIIIYTTAASMEEAQHIADALVGQQLAASVQIMPGVRSVYNWQGKIAQSDEVLCIIKTEAKRFKEIALAIEQIHSYEVPELIAVPIVHGSIDYLSWLNDQVGTES
ncbi:divalent-cation tolerance protein CutA [Blastopirellula sp. JC732]|uniref:Divalent-cation tolerance protein CutA n=1 Tax=Blastopirellula sediminis TaxID=2894196 RepID=A0A9X1MPD5_9BACT|nr:divalent-cation tolerance protein CutA [Blastopirellula sediminis]MCC9606716.1 divalent-cation tolerance protein CutA [Blastopirellula sediminis]MCC9629987.1 divalent-cation tolerance protein CutA [Blastopirellula sediminis]